MATMATNPAITVLRDPKVYLVGRQTIDDGELARFLADEGVAGWETDTSVAGEALVEVAGRLCYKSYAKPRPGGNSAYIGHILEVGHGSVLEHSVYNLIFAGVSRSFTHELVRHRARLVSLRSLCKAEVHAVLAKCGVQVLMSDLFGVDGTKFLDRLRLPAPYAARTFRFSSPTLSGQTKTQW